MFKKAYVRGVTKALIDCNAVKFANEDEAIAASDQIAEQLPEQPVGEVAPEVTAELAANLVDLSNALQESAESAAQAATAVASPGEQVAKAASLRRSANFLRQKLSVDTGATIVGDRPEQENRPENATNAEAKLDIKNRPGGDAYANVGEDGVGSQQASGAGAIASEKKVVEGTGMGPAEAGSNSATEAVKGASLRRLIRAAALGKHAEDVPGTTVAPGKTFSDPVTGEGQMEVSRRPENYAVMGEDRPGESTEAAKERAAQIGTQQSHPGQEDHEGGTNTAIKQSEEERYIRELRVLGQKYASLLPFYMNDHEKIAALQYLKGLPPAERDSVMNYIGKTAEMPAGLKKYLEAKKAAKGAAPEAEPKETEEPAAVEKPKEEEAKSASYRQRQSADGGLLTRLRRLNTNV